MRNYIVLILLSFLWASCVRNEAINPTVSFQNGNVLLPKIEFKTSKSCQVFIEYWPLDKANQIRKSKISEGIDHSIILNNLKQSTQYQYILNNITTGSKSEVLNFETGALPNDIVRTKKTLIDTTQFNGYVLIRKLSPNGSDAILNNEGEVVWYQLYDTAIRRPSIWTTKNSVLSQYDSAQIVEYDIYGNNILNFKLADYGLANMLHHEILVNDKDEMVALTLDSAKVDLRKFGGKENQYLRADGIVVLTKTGKKVWEWNLLDHYDVQSSPLGVIDLKQSLGHANSMVISNDGHYVVSFRDFSQIWKINSQDGSVMWRLGKGGDFKLDSEFYFRGQHSIYFNKRGELMMFDNGDRSGKQPSRALSFVLDEKTKVADIKINVTLPVELSAFKMCSAELITDNKYLICTSKKNGIISVVNDNADVLWRVDLSSPSYRAYYIIDPFK